MMIAFAALAATIAAITGILAIGSGRHWHFSVADYFRGKRNAMLYLWVTASTIFSITHAGFLIELGHSASWIVADTKALAWMVLHTTVSALFTLAHLFVSTTLAKEVGPVDKYLWGSRK